MKKSVELKQQRAALIEKQGGLLETRKKENRDFNETEATEFRSLNEQIEALDGQIETAETEERAAQRFAEQQAAEGKGESQKPTKKEGGEGGEKRALSQRASVLKALRSVISGKELEGAEKEMNELAIEENRNAKVDTPENSKLNIPMSFLRAASQTVTQDGGEYGGALVQDHAPRVQMPFSPAGVLDRLGVTRWKGLSGGDIPLPVLKNYEFQWLEETEEITKQKQKNAGPKLSPNRLGAAVGISNRLIMQSSIDIEAKIRQLLAQGFERAIDKAAINGSGTNNEPKGILNNTAIPVSALATAAASPSKKLIAELVSLLEVADASEVSLAFLSSPGLKFLLETTLLDAGSGRFLMEQPKNLNGYRYETSTLVPKLTGNEPLIFGDWSKMFVGEWGSLSVLLDPYTGALSNEVNLVLNGYADVEIAQPDAFAVNKFFKVS